MHRSSCREMRNSNRSWGRVCPKSRRKGFPLPLLQLSSSDAARKKLPDEQQRVKMGPAMLRCLGFQVRAINKRTLKRTRS